MTNWGSRMGIARAVESLLRSEREINDEEPLKMGDKLVASALGYSLSLLLGENG